MLVLDIMPLTWICTCVSLYLVRLPQFWGRCLKCRWSMLLVMQVIVCSVHLLLNHTIRCMFSNNHDNSPVPTFYLALI